MSNKGKAGSLIDFRVAVETARDEIDASILSLNPEWTGGSIEWFSPIKETGYEEYVDDTFWSGCLQPGAKSFWVGLQKPARFWPKGGPNWDGLAVLTKTDGKKVLLLFEAKAHSYELKSSCGAVDASSLSEIKGRIEQAFREARIDCENDPLKNYYQFSNRFAYISTLRKSIDACCIYLYFANDPYWDLSNDKTDVERWGRAIIHEHNYFGASSSQLRSSSIYELILDLKSESFRELRDSIIGKLTENMVL